MDVKRGYKQLVTLTKRVKYVMTYIKENTNINEHRRVIVKLNNKNISKSAYRDSKERFESDIMEKFILDLAKVHITGFT